MFFVAKEHTTDLVSDDYYKDGKHIESSFTAMKKPLNGRFRCRF